MEASSPEKYPPSVNSGEVMGKGREREQVMDWVRKNVSSCGNLKPGESSQAGFLGKEEVFEEVVANDCLLLKKLGITHEQIFEALDKLLIGFAERLKAMRLFGEEYFEVRNTGILIGEQFRVSANAYMGFQSCPWDCKEATKHDYSIQNEKTKKGIGFSGLLPHLIKEHFFFEGKDTGYRLEPLQAILVLEIPSPNVSKEEIEEMYYQSLLSDLDGDTRKIDLTLRKLSWFTNKPDLPDHLEKIAEKCLTEGADYSFFALIDSIPLNSRSKLNQEILRVLKERFNESKSWEDSTVSRMKKLKREVENDTNYEIVEGEYWPDYLESVKRYYSAALVDWMVKYVRDHGITLAQAAQKGARYWEQYARAGFKPSQKYKTIEEYIKNIIPLINVLSKDSLGMGKTKIFDGNNYKKPSEYLDFFTKENNDDKESLQKRVDFHQVAIQVAAVKICPYEMVYHFEQVSGILEKLGHQEEAKAARDDAILLRELRDKRVDQK